MNVHEETRLDFNYTLADGKSVPFNLTTLDRSDCCGFRAYFRVTLKSSGQLLFCRHHFYVHKAELSLASAHILDESLALKENRLLGSAN